MSINASIILVIFLIIFVVAVVAGILIFLLVNLGKSSSVQVKSRAKYRGNEGERRVARVLQQIAGSQGKVINNFIFEGARTSVQIDHILLCDFGVFVIETKNYSGIIYGDETRKEWVQYFPNSDKSNKLHNPLKQNAGHIYNLKNILPAGTPVYGIVVFVQNNVQHVTAEGVTGLNELWVEINKKNHGKVLTEMHIAKIYQVLCERMNTQISEEEHIQNVREMIAGVESNSVCPSSGGKLVERTGPNGEFIACSNFPKCKFTKNL